MKKSYFLAIAMLSMAIVVLTSCEPDEEFVPDDPHAEDTLIVAFSISSTIITSLDGYSVGLNIAACAVYDDNAELLLAFYVDPSGAMRTFKGDTARMIIGKRMTVGGRLGVYDQYNPLYREAWTVPETPIIAVVEKNNIYHFDWYFKK